MSRLLPVALLAGLAALPSPVAAGEVPVADPYRYVVVTRPAPYWGYYYAPYAAALHGLADYTRAEGEYLLLRESARQQREVTRRAKLDTRKKEWEHIKWERDFIWNVQREEEQKIIAHAYNRAKNHPTHTEIYSGGMLNILHTELSKTSRSPDSPSRPVKQEWLDAINFSSTGGNTGLLRQKDLTWPVLIQDDRFNSTRAAIEENLDAARRDAGRGKVNGTTIETLLKLKNTLDDEAIDLLRTSRSFTHRHHIHVMRFTKELNEALKLLENPKEAAFLLSAKPTARTVAELMQYMRENGLTFGPVSEGNGRHYIALHAEMAEEARALDGQPNREK